MCVSNACDAYSDTWNNHFDIYDFLGYHIRNNKTKKLVLASLPCAKTMAHGKDLNFAVCHASRAHGKVLATSSFLGGNFFLPWVHSCARQRPALPIPGCRVRFAVCSTRQKVCRGLLGLYRVPLAHGKGGVSRSEF